MDLTIEVETELDDRWLAEIVTMPGVMAYGTTQAEAITQVQALALRVMADRLEHGEMQGMVSVLFQAAEGIK